MASLFPSRSSKNKRRETVTYSPEMIEYATHATEQLSDMMSILKYHVGVQSEALATPEEPSAKDSQSLAKTILSLYKQMDGYMAILHSPAIIEVAESKISAVPNTDYLDKKAESVNQKTASTYCVSVNDNITIQETGPSTHTVKVETDPRIRPDSNTHKEGFRNKENHVGSNSAAFAGSKSLQVGNPISENDPQLRYGF